MQVEVNALSVNQTCLQKKEYAWGAINGFQIARHAWVHMINVNNVLKVILCKEMDHVLHALQSTKDVKVVIIMDNVKHALQDILFIRILVIHVWLIAINARIRRVASLALMDFIGILTRKLLNAVVALTPYLYVLNVLMVLLVPNVKPMLSYCQTRHANYAVKLLRDVWYV